MNNELGRCETGVSLVMNTTLHPDLMNGSRNALNVCLSVKPGERVLIMADLGSLTIARAMVEAASEIGADPIPVVIESLARRPASRAPARVMELLATCPVAIYTVSPRSGELGSRSDVILYVEAHGIRYAHMVGITEEIMRTGMRADYREVDALSDRVIGRFRQTREFRVTSRGGTDLIARFDPRFKWIKTAGIIGPGLWHNLPAGQVYSVPVDCEGVLVGDGCLGEHFSRKYGDLSDTPVTVHLEGGRIVEADCSDPKLREEFWSYTHTDPNSDRVGEFGIGTNFILKKYIGIMLQDEKVPGLHVAFGKPYASQTGAEWDATTHLDLVTKDCNIWTDGQQVLEDKDWKI